MNVKLIFKCSKWYGNLKLVSNINRLYSHNNGLYRTNIYKGIDKQSHEESNEIINMSNDSKSLNIPKSNNAEFPKFYYENDTIEASLNERGTIDLSSNMHANLPQPPNEAVKLHDKPYDSIVSLGEGFIKNDKFISEEQMMAHQTDNIDALRHCDDDERKLSLYLSNASRFQIEMGPDTAERISQGILQVDTALDFQHNVMDQINEYWRHRELLEDTNPDLSLFLPFSADDDSGTTMDSFLELYRLLEIDTGHDDISKFQTGQLSYSNLLDNIDIAVRKIVKEWFRKFAKLPTS